MPLSNPWHLPVVLHYLAAINPTRILDVGVGTGTYGFMIRQHLDIARERLTRESWKLTIDGIEIFEPYRNPVWGFAYDAVHIGDARHVLPRCSNYDVIVCNDVLEHLPKGEVAAFAQEMLHHAPVVIATTPNHECPQGAWGGNEAETHRCLLAASDLPSVAVERRTTVTSCFVLCRDRVWTRRLQEADRLAPQFGRPLAQNLMRRLVTKVRRALAGG
jgi:hypothetical protein